MKLYYHWLAGIFLFYIISYIAFGYFYEQKYTLFAADQHHYDGGKESSIVSLIVFKLPRTGSTWYTEILNQ